jgi:hypothetical protein
MEGLTNRRLLTFLSLLVVFFLSGCYSVSSLFCQPKWEYAGSVDFPIGNEWMTGPFGEKKEIGYMEACRTLCHTVSVSDSIRIVKGNTGYYSQDVNGNYTFRVLFECWCDTNGCGKDDLSDLSTFPS